ncbi:2-amino-3,7-dideoxy-D-threo-hept-6-ulosonate synthase [Solwaraspora sp. WMMD791]|uniref:2-amino-3,7-dideoxy-D-threo-hept-6-ulosonate synthase n=1 Tax=Solwaraspora sp. WMMD791 TaxID=3016086 RepID=UPI00249A1BB5|nr:2-amino-3,7-dideoxy-D-threo-hept-6-ulosonate synthase [Solwaraspora sp. WMMD791]WFE30114.1 2-amino-3,7-dideoxy-D-threo-hept-6-ulosonate synthase [Solwaraspora sp. WMMD791]
MAVLRSFGTQLRLRRLTRHGDGRLLVVPLDHSVSDGPLMRADRLGPLVAGLADSGVDAVVLHGGSVRAVDPAAFGTTALIVHLSASTRHAADPDAKFLVASVSAAVRRGADAVSVHVNIGSREEARQLADLATVAEEADRWGVPVLAMMYPRGPRIDDPHAPELVAHAATLAADLGADLVKVPFAGSAGAMAEVVADCPIPVVVAGGGVRDGWPELAGYVEAVMRSGAAGLAMGRNIFQAPDPSGQARRVVALVHPGRVAVRDEILAPV